MIAVRASSAREAIEALDARTDIALVLSDVVMPSELGGVDVAEHAATLDPAPPVLLTSGYADDPRVAAGSHALLAKSYDLEGLARALRACLD